MSTPRIQHQASLRCRRARARFYGRWATLLQVIPDAIILQPKTRAAVPPQRVPFDQIETLEVDQGKGMGIGKAVAIGAGVGAGAWLALMAFAFAVLGD